MLLRTGARACAVTRSCVRAPVPSALASFGGEVNSLLSGPRSLLLASPLSSFSSSPSDGDPVAATAAASAGEITTTGRGRHARESVSSILQLDESEKAQIMATVPLENIRNFSIIAHIDHGKSTLADRMLGFAGNISRDQRESGQVLDKLEVERARGITVKAQTASIFYRPIEASKGVANTSFLLNLVDCPGHVDFAYEVSRSLAACQGALLLVDASQGIQAQTLANFYIAMENDLTIVPIMTKTDLPHADPQRVLTEMVAAFGVKPEDVLRCSAKTGVGVAELFPEIIARVPPPSGIATVPVNHPLALPGAILPSPAPLRALLFDSWYDVHRGVICLVKVEDGELHVGDIINSYHEQGGPYEVMEVGVLLPESNTRIPQGKLRTGQVGYLIANIKESREVRLGDTIIGLPRVSVSNIPGPTFGRFLPVSHDLKKLGHVEARKRTNEIASQIEPLPGFRPAKSMVFAGLFPSSASDYAELLSAVERLTLNDASVTIAKEHSGALGQGFRCGFLGMLHMDVFTTRLEQEFGASVITTAPTVPYSAELHSGETISIESPGEFPNPDQVSVFKEPMVKVSIITPHDYVGPLTQLCGASRGEVEDVRFISADRALMRYKMPLAEVVVDFYQEIKSISSGYASLDYEPCEDAVGDIVKLDIKVNGESVDALSVICHRQKSDVLGRRMIGKLREAMDRQNFEIILQASLGNKIIARERLAPYRKDVLIKSGKTVGGGDNTRKKKLLEKQKEGKKRMKAVGNVEISDEAFLSVIKAQSKHG